MYKRQAVTNNCKNLDAALKFIDYCASQEGQDLLLWGIEGKDWTKDGDTYVPNEEVLDGLQNNLEKTREETGITRWTWFVRNASTHKDGSPCRMQMSRKDITATWAEKNLTNTYWDTAEFEDVYKRQAYGIGVLCRPDIHATLYQASGPPARQLIALLPLSLIHIYIRSTG